jgi:hypothetical protein
MWPAMQLNGSHALVKSCPNSAYIWQEFSILIKL